MMTTWRSVPQLDRVFEEAARSAPRSGGMPVFPIVGDVRESKDAYTLQLDLPGVRLEDLDITLERHVLSVRGERRFERGPEEKVTCGRPHGPFSVLYTLPDGVDNANVTADLTDGVLTVRAPKHPQAQPRRIPIHGGAERG